MDERLTIAEAATRLGVTTDAIRRRIRRGTLRAEKEDGRWYVVLGADQAADSTPPRPDQDRTADMIASLTDQIAFLRAELERKDAILMTLTQRLPELPERATTAPPRRRWWTFWR